MSEKKLYLKQNIQVEPLVNGWYAWVHLIPPVTSAMNVSGRYIPIMNSYVNSPMMHAAAVMNPEMKGGPFIDLGGQRVDEVRALRDETLANNELTLEFAEAIRELDVMLQSQAKGQSLEPLYEKVPDMLKGYVELVYDLNNNVSYRIFEALLYKSPYYMKQNQTLALSEIVGDRDRAFILSTPRLDDNKTVKLNIPFAHAGLDELFKMKKVPQTLEFIKEQVGVDIEKDELFESFFTEEGPKPYEAYTGEDMRIRYFGHACILVETKDVTMLMDPVLSYTYESDVSRFTYEDLPDVIDYVLITHSHQDHILMETMLQLRHKVKNIVIGRNVEGVVIDPSLKLILENCGFDNVIELRELEEIKIPNGKITGVPFLGEHHDLMIASKLGYFIEIGERKVLSVADSCNIEPMMYERVKPFLGDADVLFVGMECEGSPPSWVYGPMFTEPINREFDNERRGRGCNYAEAIDIVNRFNCKEVYVYAMGLEPWLRYILDIGFAEDSHPVQQAKKLIADCDSRGIEAGILYGEKIILKKQILEETLA